MGYDGGMTATAKQIEAQIIDDQDTAEGMDCIHCGLSAEVDLRTWKPIWADGGATFVGMDCGRDH